MQFSLSGSFQTVLYVYLAMLGAVCSLPVWRSSRRAEHITRSVQSYPSQHTHLSLLYTRLLQHNIRLDRPGFQTNKTYPPIVCCILIISETVNTQQLAIPSHMNVSCYIDLSNIDCHQNADWMRGWEEGRKHSSRTSQWLRSRSGSTQVYSAEPAVTPHFLHYTDRR